MEWARACLLQVFSDAVYAHNGPHFLLFYGSHHNTRNVLIFGVNLPRDAVSQFGGGNELKEKMNVRTNKL